MEHSRRGEGGSGPSPLLHLHNAGDDLDLHLLLFMNVAINFSLSFYQLGMSGLVWMMPYLVAMYMALDVHNMDRGVGYGGCGDHCDQGVGGE